MKLAITILLATLPLTLAGASPVAAESVGDELLVRVFDISPLTTGIREGAVPPLGFLPLRAAWFVPEWLLGQQEGIAEPAECPGFFEPEEIADLIQTLLASLDDGASEEEGYFDISGSKLLVRQRPEVLERIEALLTGLVDWTGARIPVRVYALSGGETTVEPGILGPAECRKLTGGEAGLRVDGVLEGEAVPGRRITLGRIDERAFVGDYNVEVAQSARIAEPIPEILRTGLLTEVKAYLMTGGGVAVDAAVSLVRPEEPIRRIRTQTKEIGVIELPSLRTARLGFRSVLPDGGGILLRAGGAETETPGWVLLTAGPSRRSPNRFAWGAEEISLFPIGFLTAPQGGFGTRTASLSRVYGYQDVTDFLQGGFEEDTEPEPWISVDDLVGHLDQDVLGTLEESFDQVFLAASSDRLAVRGNRDLLERVALYLEELEAVRARTIAVRTDVFRVPETKWRAALAELPGLAPIDTGSGDGGAGDLEPGDERKLRTLLEGDRVAGAAVATLQGTASAVACGIERRILADYDVEIAQDSVIGDPMVQVVWGGLALDLEPRVDLRGREIRLAMRGEISRCSAETTENYGTENIGTLDIPVKTTLPIGLEAILPNGRTSVRLLGREGGADGTVWLVLLRADTDSGSTPMRRAR